MESNEDKLKYAQNVIAILQKNCNELFARNVQLEAQVLLAQETNKTDAEFEDAAKESKKKTK